MILALAGLLVGLPSAQEKKTAASSTGENNPRTLNLIRKDLLEGLEKKPAPPERNIFRPDRRRPQAAGGGERPGDSPGVDVVGGSDEPRPDADTALSVSTGIVVQLRYIGYIGSRARAVAVVLVQGEAQAVSVGDSPSEGLTILAITPREIEFTGPDERTRRVSIEGEER